MRNEQPHDKPCAVPKYFIGSHYGQVHMFPQSIEDLLASGESLAATGVVVVGQDNVMDKTVCLEIGLTRSG